MLAKSQSCENSTFKFIELLDWQIGGFAKVISRMSNGPSRGLWTVSFTERDPFAN